MNMSSLLAIQQDTPFLKRSIKASQRFGVSIFNDTVSAAGWNIVEREQLIEIRQGTLLTK